VVDDGVAEIGFELNAAARTALDVQVRLLTAWNAAINLSALRTEELVARGHLLDSLAAVPALRVLAGAGPTIIDIGSGPGYPGLPLAVALPARRAALVDSIGKKASFLEVVASAAMEAMRAAPDAPPEIVALRERAEDLADEADHREGWDVVTARAVGSLAEVAELGLPLARRGGHVVAWKRDAGDGALEREIGAARDLINAAGGAPPRRVDLPAANGIGLDGHCLIVIEKRRTTPLRYPRPAGERKRAALP
jgi:16S rRNA (guanine527-N7)-methyltransferase